jgi:hypothetical protein
MKNVAIIYLTQWYGGVAVTGERVNFSNESAVHYIINSETPLKRKILVVCQGYFGVEVGQLRKASVVVPRHS